MVIFFYHKFRNVSWYVIRNMYVMTNQPYTVLIEIIIFIFVWSKENSEAVIDLSNFIGNEYETGTEQHTVYILKLTLLSILNS